MTEEVLEIGSGEAETPEGARDKTEKRRGLMFCFLISDSRVASAARACIRNICLMFSL